MLNRTTRGRDVRRLVHSLEGWMIATLAELGVQAHRAEGRIGIWVGEGPKEAKIAALGIRISAGSHCTVFRSTFRPMCRTSAGSSLAEVSEFG